MHDLIRTTILFLALSSALACSGGTGIGGGGGSGANSPIGITITTLPAATLSQPYQAQLTATGGSAPYTWAILPGVLPPGLSLNGAFIVGTPSDAAGSPFSFTAQVTDAAL